MIKVEKLGQVLLADSYEKYSEMATHAVYPTPLDMGDNVIRIYFCSRNTKGQGQVFWCDVDVDNPTVVLDLCQGPVLRSGQEGAFDQDGISIGNFVQADDNKLLLYYMGWNQGLSVPFRNAIGCAEIDDVSTSSVFRRNYPGPLLDRNVYDPFTLSYPYVYREDKAWKMIYGSQRGPSYTPMHHVLVSACSHDGVHWSTCADSLLDLQGAEIGLSRPWRIQKPDGSVFLLCSAATLESYKIIMAKQNGDGSWTRVVDDLVPRSGSGWDSEDTTYPSYIEINGRSFLFYNGNGYGRTGFGVCELHWL